MASFRTSRPLGIFGQLILGMIFFGVGAGFLYFVAADYTLVCDRPENACRLEKKGMFHDREIVANLKLNDIKAAEVQESRDSKGKSHYQVMLVTDSIRIPFSNGLNPGYESCNKTTSAINAFLHSTDKNLSVTQSGTVLKIFGFIFAAVGAYVALRAFAIGLIRILKLALLFGK